MGGGKNIAYVRVSTAEQNETRQKEALKKYDIDKWFIEKASGKDTNRQDYKKCWNTFEKMILSMSKSFQG